MLYKWFKTHVVRASITIINKQNIEMIKTHVVMAAVMINDINSHTQYGTTPTIATPATFI